MEFTCEYCGRVIEADEELLETKSGHVCAECAEEHYAFCQNCEKYALRENMHIVEVGYRRGYDPRICEEFVCDVCLHEENFFYCEHCGTWYDGNHIESYDTADGKTICEACREDYYRECRNCGDVYHEDDMYYDDYEEEYYCHNCNNQRGSIENYSYKPKPIIKTTHDQFDDVTDVKELIFGVENEIDDGNDPYGTATDLCAASEDIYIKHDGSLGDNGLEIVTHPCTLEYHMTRLGWENICNVALNSHYTSHDARTCGLHVHVGRYQLGATEEERFETIAKIVVLVWRHWDSIVRFSRRRRSQINDWACKPDLDIRDVITSLEDIHEMVRRERSLGRYRAVNLTNSNTIEFRIFNGTLKPETIKATLQLVSNICKAAMENNMHWVLRSSWNDICRCEMHRELELYLKARGIGDEEAPPTIRLRTQPANANAEEISVGDYIRIKRNSDYFWQCREGAIGIVATIDRGWSQPEYLIEFPANAINTRIWGTERAYTYWATADVMERLFTQEEVAANLRYNR